MEFNRYFNTMQSLRETFREMMLPMLLGILKPKPITVYFGVILLLPYPTRVVVISAARKTRFQLILRTCSP